MPNEDRTAAGGARPLLLDELARRDDLPATEGPPEEIATALATPRLPLSGIEGVDDVAGLLRRLEGDSGFELRLPLGARVGRPGRGHSRLSRAEQDLPRADYTKPMRPAWVTHSLQPRLASQMTARPPMRRVGGARLQPYYGVFGPDDRQVYYPSTYPWNCIGRIFTWNNWAAGGGWSWSGAGVLVGPRHVLTAGHVCPWGSSSWGMQFVAGYWDGAPVPGPGGGSWVSDFHGWDTNNTVAANDMAVLRLFDPVGSALGWMGTKVYDDGWQGGAYWTLAGYPGMIAGGERPSYQSGIAVDDDDEDGDAMELEHQGDSTPGDSGGPFFATWDDGPHAIGTTSGGESYSGPLGIGSEDNNIEAGGKAMVDLVNWGLSNWT
jgi:V8-like Glu-specific endopeptidase